MKVRITTQGKSLAVDMTQEDAEAIFKLFALRMLGVFDVKEKQETRPAYTQHKSKVYEPKQELRADETGQEEKAAYRGFMYIKCKHCGEIKGFCIKEEMMEYHCNTCEENTEFGVLKPLYVNCKCGKSFKYMTNMDAEMFDIECVSCGNPVSVEWNDKKKVYQTMN